MDYAKTILVLGLAFTCLNAFHFFLCGVPLMQGGPVPEPAAYHILLVGSTVVATALIGWYAWKWPVVEKRRAESIEYGAVRVWGR